MAFEPRFPNLVALLNSSVTKYAERPLFGTRKPHGWEWISYRQFGELCDNARAGLGALGIGAGDRVAVISNNRLEWAVCEYGAYTLSAIYVPMYEAQLDKDWQFILRDSGAKLCVVANAGIEQRIERMRASLPDLEHVVCFDSARYAQLFEQPTAQPVAAHAPSASDVASLIYTSGTTGNPKGVRLTHYNLAATASAVLEAAVLEQAERALSFLPWAHVYGGCVEVNCLMGVGGSMAICDNTDNLLGYLSEVKPTMLVAVPRIWNRIYDGVRKQIGARPKPIQQLFERGLAARTKQRQGQPLSVRDKVALWLAQNLIFAKIRRRLGGELRFAISGAAALEPQVAEFIDNLGIQVYEGYGMTESSGGVISNSPENRRIGSVGKPIAGVEIKLDKSAPGAHDDEGEIVIYGPAVMAGYHNQPDATRVALTADGGLRSGDLGRRDADGFIYITGRVKELYKLQNGKYVAPAPLEEKLQLSAFIAQSVVYGSDLPHNVALIVPDMKALTSWAEATGVPTEPDALLRDARTRALIRGEIDRNSAEFKHYEAIRDFILTPEEMSTSNDMLTPTLKIKRRNVMARYESRLKALYAQQAVA